MPCANGAPSAASLVARCLLFPAFCSGRAKAGSRWGRTLPAFVRGRFHAHGRITDLPEPCKGHSLQRKIAGLAANQRMHTRKRSTGLLCPWHPASRFLPSSCFRSRPLPAQSVGAAAVSEMQPHLFRNLVPGADLICSGHQGSPGTMEARHTHRSYVPAGGGGVGSPHPASAAKPSATHFRDFPGFAFPHRAVMAAPHPFGCPVRYPPFTTHGNSPSTAKRPELCPFAAFPRAISSLLRPCHSPFEPPDTGRTPPKSRPRRPKSTRSLAGVILPAPHTFRQPRSHPAPSSP